MSNIIIGKYTLESLTSGMYSDPYVIYREYIQNATDSIDIALQQGVLASGDERIDIFLLPAERRIMIVDNGLGVPGDLAERILISIGNSQKSSTKSRGFRGIGRLAALSYCKKLTFETSSIHEKHGVRIEIDSHHLSELLSTTSDRDTSVLDVLQQVYSVETYAEKENQHYFRVILDGVDETSNLCNVDDVRAYISQNAPIPYDVESFPWGQEISQRLQKDGYTVQCYNTFIHYGNECCPVYKPYASEFLVDKSKQLTDRIQDIEILYFFSDDKRLAAIGWLAKINYLGSIYDKSIKGIRLRKGNILIGDYQTLNSVFKDPRFNGWAIGEIFVVDPQLIPNARRDNFEKNKSYYSFVEHLTPLAAQITRQIRSASISRNQELSKALNSTVEASQSAEDALQEGVHKTKKAVLQQNLVAAQNRLSSINGNGDADAYIQELAFESLDLLIGKIKGATSYKAINLLDNLSNTEKQVLERVFNILIASKGEDATPIIDTILSGFAQSKFQ